MPPEISVIVPVLNEAKYPEDTLQSIVDQNTNVNFELIVSDNGSADGSIDIAEKYDKGVELRRTRNWRYKAFRINERTQ